MNIDRIRAAARRNAGYVRETPMLASPFLDEVAGRRVLVKAECLQHTGSFKYRGARSAVSALVEGGYSSGILAYSSGNHAQGVARAAREFGLHAVIIMPSDAPEMKIANTRGLGADVVLYNRANENREALGEAMQAERGLTLIRPYDEPEVIAGQGTCGLEIAAQTHGLNADVLVCCGGGGLSSGVALALEADAPGLRVRPVEPKGFDDVSLSLSAGQVVENDKLTGSICDAILTPCPGKLTFPILQRLAGPGLVVSDEEALRAMALAFRHLKIVLEPGGAVALAAALFRDASDPVIAVATGGNVDPDTMSQALAV